MKEYKTSNLQKAVKLENLKPLSREQLETVIGGPETSRGTETGVAR
ncbi:hypothetical protein [Flavobacterium collinsii]|jgi:hypothetical protein|uniref:Bacteriocin-type signal sequence n=1 Tax=Flavobacterium collinsii TaxID=1114861 RepID=A0ABM8KJV2_9FLAO|nr:hypothetical protein [Flavobacterium collinsii]CAA9199284.1 hypothetical protein FLACOL7796_02651 [Flavobacterium collinsii]